MSRIIKVYDDEHLGVYRAVERAGAPTQNVRTLPLSIQQYNYQIHHRLPVIKESPGYMRPAPPIIPQAPVSNPKFNKSIIVNKPYL